MWWREALEPVHKHDGVVGLVLQCELAVGDARPQQFVPRIAANWGQFALQDCESFGPDRVEQAILSIKMVVDGHRGDVGLARDGAHREALGTGLTKQLERSIHDLGDDELRRGSAWTRRHREKYRTMFYRQGVSTTRIGIIQVIRGSEIPSKY